MADLGNAVTTHPGQQKQPHQLGRLELVITRVMTDQRTPREAHVYLKTREELPYHSAIGLDPTKFNGGIKQGNVIIFDIDPEQQGRILGVPAVYDTYQQQVYPATPASKKAGRR